MKLKKPTTTSAKLDYLIGKVDGLTNDVSSLKNNVSGLKSDVSELKTDMKYVKNEIDGLTMMTKHLMENAASQTEVEEVKQRITVLEQS